MKCNTCGRQAQNEEANFCEYCGGSFREHMHTAINSAPREQINGGATSQMSGTMAMQMSNTMTGQKSSEVTNIEKPVSFLNWLGSYGLLFIPLIGWLIFIVMLFVWAFAGTVPTTKKNWARVSLIFVAIVIIIIVAYLVMVFSSPMFQQMYQDMQNGTFDYSSYYKSLN